MGFVSNKRYEVLQCFLRRKYYNHPSCLEKPRLQSPRWRQSSAFFFSLSDTLQTGCVYILLTTPRCRDSFPSHWLGRAAWLHPGAATKRQTNRRVSLKPRERRVPRGSAESNGLNADWGQGEHPIWHVGTRKDLGKGRAGLASGKRIWQGASFYPRGLLLRYKSGISPHLSRDRPSWSYRAGSTRRHWRAEGGQPCGEPAWSSDASEAHLEGLEGEGGRAGRRQWLGGALLRNRRRVYLGEISSLEQNPSGSRFFLRSAPSGCSKEIPPPLAPWLRFWEAAFKSSTPLPPKEAAAPD